MNVTKSAPLSADAKAALDGALLKAKTRALTAGRPWPPVSDMEAERRRLERRHPYLVGLRLAAEERDRRRRASMSPADRRSLDRALGMIKRSSTARPHGSELLYV